jgi:phospholipid/cholesterol/gamma-HCH transport system ATP-binding protein
MPGKSGDSILRFEDVSVSFDEEPALRRVSFDVKAGETRLVYGAAGSGKSVMLKVALGLLQPDSGRVFVFGQDVTELSEEERFALRAKMGVLFQEGGLFDSLTVEENVAYPLLNQSENGHKRKLEDREVQQRVRETLSFVELEQTLEKFPSELSGGMRRRVGIARAIVTDPALTLYDSPTAGLDPITAATIIALVIKARDTRNTTSIIVSHRYQDGKMLANYRHDPVSGRIERVAGTDSKIHEQTLFMVLREGRLVFDDTEEELLAATDPYISKFKPVRS